jgi:hypothetical protein
MATDEKRTFPTLPGSVWWSLRRKFRQSVPAKVTTSYLQTALGIGEKSAINALPQLRSVGLVDQDGKPTQLAHQWRTDEEYAAACEAMLSALYPQELIDAVPPADPDRTSARNWFMRQGGVGEGSAKQMAAFYVLLCAKDPAGGEERPTRESTPRQRQRRTTSAPRSAPAPAPAPTPAPASAQSSTVIQPHAAGPALHIDVQIHIPADATSDQIDAIFGSMAKHLYRRT